MKKVVFVLLFFTIFFNAYGEILIIKKKEDVDVPKKVMKIKKEEDSKKHITYINEKKDDDGYMQVAYFFNLNNRTKLLKKIKAICESENIDYKLIFAIIAVESKFNRFALSHKGAMGLMQLMPSTAARLGVSRPFSIEENVRGGIRYFKKLYERYGSVKLALAAYNAGPNAVAYYGGIPPYSETKNYVKKIIKIYEQIGGDYDIFKRNSRLKIIESKEGLVITNEMFR